MHRSEDKDLTIRKKSSGTADTDTSTAKNEDACLIVLKGNDENKKFNLFIQHESPLPIESIKTTFKIGREQKYNDICIEDNRISRNHAVLDQEGRDFFISDCNSTNGTFVNNEKIIKHHSLKNQDRIKLGGTTLKFLQGDIENLFIENLRKKANIDELTGTYNRQYFNEQFRRSYSLAERYQKPLSLILFDIDHFKRINDTFGHTAGDYILTELSRIIKNEIRKSDIFSRVGGEEFAVLCDNSDIMSARILAEKIRQSVAEYGFIFKGKEISVTVSLGVSEYIKSMKGTSDLYEASDARLYEAKNSGRNRLM